MGAPTHIHRSPQDTCTINTPSVDSPPRCVSHGNTNHSRLQDFQKIHNYQEAVYGASFVSARIGFFDGSLLLQLIVSTEGFF